jgi:hypothetical protein
LLFGLAALPGWFLFFQGGDNVAWLYGTDQILRGSSVYDLQASYGANPYARVYPYLPSFAIFNAILIAPFTALLYLTSTGYSLVNFGPDGRFMGGLAYPEWYIALGIVVTGIWSYIALVLLPAVARALFDGRETRFIAVAMVLVTPYLWTTLLLSQVDTFLALLALMSVVASSRQRWMLAGVLVGLATFKFTGLVLLPVLLVWTLRYGGKKPFVLASVGLLISQIPSALYFAVFPDDLFLLFEAKGGLSIDAYTSTGRQLFLRPLQWIGITDWYHTIGYPLLAIVMMALGGAVALRRPVGLMGGFAVAYVSVSLLIPGEQNVAPLAIFVLIPFVPLWHRTSAKIVAFAVIASAGYSEIDLLVGKLSRTLVIGFAGAEHLVFFVLQLALMTATVYIVFASAPDERPAQQLADGDHNHN